MERYNYIIQYAAILGAFLLPMVLVARLYYMLKTKLYPLKKLLNSVVYLALIIVTYALLNHAQRFYLAIYLGLLAILVVIFISVMRLVWK